MSYVPLIYPLLSFLLFSTLQKLDKYHQILNALKRIIESLKAHQRSYHHQQEMTYVYVPTALNRHSSRRFELLAERLEKAISHNEVDEVIRIANQAKTVIAVYPRLLANHVLGFLT